MIHDVKYQSSNSFTSVLLSNIEHAPTMGNIFYQICVSRAEK